MKRRTYRARKVKQSKVPLKEQMTDLKRAAKKRGLCIRATPSLSKTPFRAMNPRAARELGIKWSKHIIGYDPHVRMPKSERVMDERHEIIEYDQIGKGHHYKVAHRYANRRQRTVGAIT
jgi:ribosomal protein S12